MADGGALAPLRHDDQARSLGKRRGSLPVEPFLPERLANEELRKATPDELPTASYDIVALLMKIGALGAQCVPHRLLAWI